MRISVIIVLYNTRVEDVACLDLALSNSSVSQIVICDNSTVPNDNVLGAERLGLTYIDMGGNRGLPVAYNAAIRLATGDVVCFFDDDTAVDEGYFDAVSRFYREDERWDIALPLVRAGDIILSPCRFRGHRVVSFPDSLHIEDSPHMSGINSGMAVRRSVFNVVRYDERLFLDLVDHKLIVDARAAGLQVAYLRGPVLEQDFSLTTDTADAAAKRLSIFAHDALIFYSDGLSSRIYCELMLLFRRVKLVMKYKSLRFLSVPKFQVRSNVE